MFIVLFGTLKKAAAWLQFFGWTLQPVKDLMDRLDLFLIGRDIPL
jgi:hypothetical protein